MDAEQPIQRYTLAASHELRMECDPAQPVVLRLEEGSAEIFGAELQRGQSIRLDGQKLAVFTWEGCTVSVEGQPSMIYEAEETPMASYLNVHQVLSERRRQAHETGSAGPNCIIVGPTDSGKSTICKLLVNWAVRSGWQPTLVDLDIGQGSITVPGCIAATPIETPVDVEEGYPLDMPLVYFYGHASPSENAALYKRLVENLAATLKQRASVSASAAASGLIINTFGWVDGLGYELQLHAIRQLQADVVLVMEQDRLYAQLQSDLKGKTPPVSVVKLSKSGGVVKREADERRGARDQRIREYFYGSKGQLAPATQEARVDQLVVYRVGGGFRAPTSALPIGGRSLVDPLRLQNLALSTDLMQSLLAVSHAQTPEQILNSNVAGFILVKDVDTVNGSVTYTTPCPGQLPGRYVVMGSIRSAID